MVIWKSHFRKFWLGPYFPGISIQGQIYGTISVSETILAFAFDCQVGFYLFGGGPNPNLLPNDGTALYRHS